jgi:hypothetical protein
LPRGEQSHGLARANAVLLDGVGEASLIARSEGAEGVGGARREPPGIEARGEFGSELAGEGEPALGPTEAVAEELADGEGRQPVLVGQGTDYAGLIHGAHGAARGVGLKHARLGAHAGGVLDDDGNAGAPLRLPGGEALVAVEDLELAVPGRGHTKRHRGEGGIRVGAPAAQVRQRRAQALDGEFGDQGRHGRRSSRGRSWKSG